MDFDNLFDYSEKMISFLNNNVYLTSSTESMTGIATSGTFQESYSAGGNTDNFIVKFGRDGNRIQGTYYGGEKLESASGVIPLANNSFYVYGTTGSTNNMSTEGSQQINLEGVDGTTFNVFNAYLARFDEEELNTKSENILNIALYPNPNKGLFTISNAEEVKFNLFDFHGRLVHSQEGNASISSMRIDVQKLNSGMYFGVIKNEGLQKTIKIIIK